MKAIYIHYPYCLYKCHYCDFNSHAYAKSDIPQNQYTQALLAELQRRRVDFTKSGTGFFPDGTKIKTIFLGGGTPSLMNPNDLEKILNALRDVFLFDDHIEITLESNPGTVTFEKFRDFKSAGVNRVSLGVQSLHDRYLSKFGRIHTAREAHVAVEAAVAAGIPRISTDLIYGFPNQSLSEWQKDLDEMLSWNLGHASCYALTAEEGTEFAKSVKNQLVAETNPDLFADFQEFTYARLAATGRRAYEVSNFALPGEESRHNLAYWNYESYLGLGAGACSQFVSSVGANNHSPLQGNITVRRQTNYRAPEHYMRTIACADNFYTTEVIEQTTAMQEFVMMGLRLQDGVDENRFQNLFQKSFRAVFVKAIAQNLENGRLVYERAGLGPAPKENHRLKVTQQGFLMNHALVWDFFNEVGT